MLQNFRAVIDKSASGGGGGGGEEAGRRLAFVKSLLDSCVHITDEDSIKAYQVGGGFHQAFEAGARNTYYKTGDYFSRCRCGWCDVQHCRADVI